MIVCTALLSQIWWWPKLVTHALCSAAMGEPLSCLNFIQPQKLSKHDNFLVHASDGIWDVFTKEDIC